MRILKLLILWATAIGLAGTLFSYGQVKYYRYENAEGSGYTLNSYWGWKGDSLDGTAGYEKGFKYRGDRYKFERNAEARTILIILILAGACAASPLVWKRSKAAKSI